VTKINQYAVGIAIGLVLLTIGWTWRVRLVFVAGDILFVISGFFYLTAFFRE